MSLRHRVNNHDRIGLESGPFTAWSKTGSHQSLSTVLNRDLGRSRRVIIGPSGLDRIEDRSESHQSQGCDPNLFRRLHVILQNLTFCLLSAKGVVNSTLNYKTHIRRSGDDGPASP